MQIIKKQNDSIPHQRNYRNYINSMLFKYDLGIRKCKNANIYVGIKCYILKYIFLFKFGVN